MGLERTETLEEDQTRDRVFVQDWSPLSSEDFGHLCASFQYLAAGADWGRGPGR